MIDNIVGHRGVGFSYPENTRGSFKKAAELGLMYVEIDARLTKDNILIVSHDDNLARVSGKSVLVSQTNWQDLQQIDVATTHTLRDIDTPEFLMTLDDTLDYLQSLHLVPQIELKISGHQSPEDLAFRAYDILHKHYKDTPNECRPLITSFDPECLKTFKETAASEFDTGLLVDIRYSTEWRSFAERSDCSHIHFPATHMTESDVNEAREKGYRVNAYHINHPALASRVLALGCERFTCDIPDLIFKPQP